MTCISDSLNDTYASRLLFGPRNPLVGPRHFVSMATVADAAVGIAPDSNTSALLVFNGVQYFFG